MYFLHVIYMRKNVTLSLPVKTVKDGKRVAIGNDLTFSHFVRVAIDQLVDDYERL